MGFNYYLVILGFIYDFSNSVVVKMIKLREETILYLIELDKEKNMFTYSELNSLKESIKGIENRPIPIIKGKNAIKFHNEINDGEISKEQREYLDNCKKIIKRSIK